MTILQKHKHANPQYKTILDVLNTALNRICRITQINQIQFN